MSRRIGPGWPAVAPARTATINHRPVGAAHGGIHAESKQRPGRQRPVRAYHAFTASLTASLYPMVLCRRVDSPPEKYRVYMLAPSQLTDFGYEASRI